MPTFVCSISTYQFLMMTRRRSESPVVFVPMQLPSTIRDVFLAWQNILVESGYFGPASNVIISLDEDEFPQSGAAYALLCPLYFVPDNGSVNGGGRICTILDGQFSVIVRTRNRMNLAFQDSYLLQNDNPTGVFWLADQVVDALHMEFVTDDLGNSLVAEPPRLNSYAKASRAGTQSEWTGLRLVFDVSLQMQFSSQI